MIEDIGNQFNISPKDLQDLLLKNGYQYYVFMNYWTKMNRQELCEYLVNELNCQQRFKIPQFQRNEIPHYERLIR